MRRKTWVLFLCVALVATIASWVFRHPIRSAISEARLPTIAPPPSGTLRFAVIGDFGSGGAHVAEVARLIESWHPEFIATVGDNNYPAGAADTIDGNIGRFFHAYISPYKGSYGYGAKVNRFFPIPGHRDWDTGALQPYLDYFTLPGNERYYDMVQGAVQLFMLDTDEREPDGATVDSIQARWLQKRLAQSNASWKLVFAHHAPYTSHSVEDTVRMRWPFKAWGADAVLSGFYHVYERLSVDDIPYFVNGTGGAWISHFGEVDVHSRVRYAENYGAMLIDASNERIVFRFVNRDGQIVDEYSIVRHS